MRTRAHEGRRKHETSITIISNSFKKKADENSKDKRSTYGQQFPNRFTRLGVDTNEEHFHISPTHVLFVDLCKSRAGISSRRRFILSGRKIIRLSREFSTVIRNSLIRILEAQMTVASVSVLPLYLLHGVGRDEYRS